MQFWSLSYEQSVKHVSKHLVGERAWDDGYIISMSVMRILFYCWRFIRFIFNIRMLPRRQKKKKNLSIIIWICDGLSFEGIQAYKRPKPEAEYGSLLRSTTLLKFVSCNRNIAYVCAAVLNVGKNIISVCRTANTSDGYLWLCNSASCCHRSHWHDRKHLGNAGT